jgi:phage gpG-like protein
MPVVVRFNGSALRSIALQGAEDDLRVRANRVLNAARRLAPVDEGRLRASIAVEFSREGDTTVARIGSNLPYAMFVHEGTGLYGPRHAMIRPRAKQFMRWPVKNNSGSGNRRYSGGSTSSYAYARQTRGVPARPFLRDALDAAR